MRSKDSKPEGFACPQQLLLLLVFDRAFSIKSTNEKSAGCTNQCGRHSTLTIKKTPDFQLLPTIYNQKCRLVRTHTYIHACVTFFYCCGQTAKQGARGGPVPGNIDTPRNPLSILLILYSVPVRVYAMFRRQYPFFDDTQQYDHGSHVLRSMYVVICSTCTVVVPRGYDPILNGPLPFKGHTINNNN